MKSFKYIIPLTMILMLVECKDDHTSPDDNNNDGPPTIVVDAPQMVIPIQRGAELFYNYKANRIPIIEEYQNSNLPQGEEKYLATTSITFNYEELKRYLKYIEQQSKDANTDIEGLRVYLGQYSTSSNEQYPRAETVFFNPTMLVDKNEVAFAIYNQNGKPVAVTVGEVIGNKKPVGKNNLVLTLQDDGITSLAGNQGHRRPPPINNDDGDY